jgi:hypothetical protein
LRVVSLDGFEAGEGAVVVEIVEMVVGFADLGGEIDGVGVGGGIVRVSDNWCCQQEGEKKEAQGFDTACYGSSPKPVTLVFFWCIFFLYIDDRLIRS